MIYLMKYRAEKNTGEMTSILSKKYSIVYLTTETVKSLIIQNNKTETHSCNPFVSTFHFMQKNTPEIYADIKRKKGK